MMNTGDESIQTLVNLDESENKNLNGLGVHKRNRRKPIRMTLFLQCLISFAILLIVFYGMQLAANKKNYITRFMEKNKIFVQDNQLIFQNKEKYYDCINNQCIPRLLNENGTTSLKECIMLCNMPSLWPKPKFVKVKNKHLSTFRRDHIITNINAPRRVNDSLKEVLDIFILNLPSIEKSVVKDVDLSNVYINIKVTSTETKIQLATDESYKLSINKVKKYVTVKIIAKTYFGARHGIETLSQLIVFNTFSKKLRIYHDVEIQDSPAFPHRGLMVDTARNYFPIKKLLTVLDGMAMNKMNVFHLHLTDSVSFPIVLPSNPWMAQYGSYNSEMVYFPEDIRGLIEYARIRGIRVILEIDAPSHVNAGWNHLNTDEDKIIICGEEDIFNGHLNPDSKRAQKLLKSVYADLLKLGTDTETFHIGGDEVNSTCLETTNAARLFNDLGDLWVDYMNKILKTVTRAFHNAPPKNLVIWSSELTDSKLNKLRYSENLVVQYWFGSLENILQNGNKVIYSTVGKWYLDCGFGSWKPSETAGSCDPYTPWNTFYNYRPWEEYKEYKKQVLGGEACLWTEQVGVDTLETRIWPRTTAFAERLWSDLPETTVDEVTTRFLDQTDRMVDRGIKVDTVWPKWCSLNPGKCF